jgi:glutamate synthase domain-containing protein 1
VVVAVVLAQQQNTKSMPSKMANSLLATPLSKHTAATLYAIAPTFSAALILAGMRPKRYVVTAAGT